MCVCVCSGVSTRWEADTTYRMVRPGGVEAAAIFERDALVIAEDEARVAGAALHAHVAAAGRSHRARARLGTRAHAQRVRAIGGTVQGCAVQVQIRSNVRAKTQNIFLV